MALGLDDPGVLLDLGSTLRIREVLAAGGTGVVSAVAVLGAGGIGSLGLHQGVALGLDDPGVLLDLGSTGLVGEVLAAGGTSVVSAVAVLGAGSIDSLGLHQGVAGRIGVGIDVVVTAAAAGIGGVALLGAGGIGDGGNVVMAQRIQIHGHLMGAVFAGGYIDRLAALGTGRLGEGDLDITSHSTDLIAVAGVNGVAGGHILAPDEHRLTIGVDVDEGQAAEQVRTAPSIRSADAAQHGEQAGGRIKGHHPITLPIAGHAQVDQARQIVIVHGLMDPETAHAVDRLGPERSDLGGQAGGQIVAVDGVVEGGQQVDGAVAAHRQATEAARFRQSAQIGDGAGLKIDLQQEVAADQCRDPLVLLGPDGANGQHPIVGRIVLHVRDLEEQLSLHLAEDRLVVELQLLGDDLPLHGIRIQEEEGIVLAKAIDRIAHIGDGGDAQLLALGQIVTVGLVHAVDHRPTHIGGVPGQEAGIRIDHRDLDRGGQRLIAIGGGSGDLDLALGHAGDHTVLIHSGDGVIAGGPLHLRVQVHGHGGQGQGHGLAGGYHALGRLQEQVAQFHLAHLRVILAQDVHPADLGAAAADLAQIVGDAGIRLHDRQAAGGAGAGPERGGPVQQAVVVVIGKRGHQIALHAGAAHFLHRQSLGVDGIQHRVGELGDDAQPGIVGAVGNAVLHGIQHAAVGGGDAHEALLQLEDREDPAIAHVHHIQVVVVAFAAGACDGVHGAGGVVIGHVIDEGEALAHVVLLYDLKGIRVHDHELPVGVPVTGIVAVGIQLAVHILAAVELVVRQAQQVGAFRIVGREADPVLAAVGGQVRHHMAHDIVSALDHGDGEAEVEHLVVIPQHTDHFGLAHTGGGDGAVLIDHGHVLIQGDHGQLLVGGVEGQNGHVRVHRLTVQDEHIVGDHFGDIHLRQSGHLLFGHIGVHAHELEQPGIGGIAQIHHHAVLHIDPADGGAVAPGPQEHIVGVIPAHGLDVVQDAQLFHQDDLIERAVLIDQLDQVPGVVQGIQDAVIITCQGHQAQIALGHGHGLAIAHIDDADLGLLGVGIGKYAVHQARGIVIGHVHGGRIHALQFGDFPGGPIPAVEAAVGIVAVEAAVVAVVVTGQEVHRGQIVQIVVHGLHVHIDHVAIVAIHGEVVIGVEVAFHQDRGDGDGLLHPVGIDGDGGLTRADGQDGAALHDRHRLVRGGPGPVLHLIVPGDGRGAYAGGLAHSQQYILCRDVQVGDGLGRGEGVGGVLQGQQAHQFGGSLILHQLAFAIVALGQEGAGEAAPVGGIHHDHLGGGAGPGAAEVGPVELALGVGQGLSIVGGLDGLAGAVVHDDRHFLRDLTAVLAGGGLLIRDLGQRVVVLHIQVIQLALVVADGVDGALSIVGDGPGGVAIVAVALDRGKVAGEHIHGVQGHIGPILRHQVHGLGSVIEGHIQHVDAQVGDHGPIEQAGIEDDVVTQGIHGQDLPAHILGGVDGSLLQIVVGPHGDVGGLLGGAGLVHGDPAVHMVRSDRFIIDPVGIDLGLVHFRQIVAGGLILDLIVALVGAVVGQRHGELGAKAGDIEGDHIGAVIGGLEHIIEGLAVQAGPAGIEQVDARQCGDIGSLHHHVIGGLVGRFVGHRQLVHVHKLRTVGIHINGDLHGMLPTVAIVHLGGDGQHDLSAVGQDLAVVIQVVIHPFAVPAVHPRHHLTISASVHGLGVVDVDFLMDHSITDGIGEGHLLGVTQEGQVHIIDTVDVAVPVGRDHVVGIAVGHVTVRVQGRPGIGVDAQHPVAAAEVRPHHMVVLVSFRQSVGRRHVPEAVVVPVSRVEHRRFGPVAVEAQVGHAHLHFAFGVGQVDVAFHIAAVGPVGGKVGDVFLRQGDGRGHLGGAARGHGNALLVEGHSAAESGLVLGHEVQAHLRVVRIDRLGQDAAVQGVGLLFIGEVVDLEAEAPGAGGTVAQLGLGPAAVHGQVCLVGHRVIGVHQASALLTGRSFQAGDAADHGNGGAHEQRLRHIPQLAGAGVRELALQVLHHQSGNARHLGRGHGGAGHDAIAAAVIARIHIAAHAGDVRHQPQVRGHAPGGEAAHLAAIHIVGKTHLLGDDQGLGLGRFKGMAAAQADQARGDLGELPGIVVDLHTEVEDVLFHIVPDQTGNSAGRLGVEDLGAEIERSTNDDGHLAFHQAVAVIIVEVRFLTEAVDHHIFQLLTAQGPQGHLVLIRILVEDLGAVSQGEELGRHLLVVHGRHGHHVIVCRGRTHRGVVRVGSGVGVGAPQIAVGAGALVAGREVHHDILIGDPVIDPIDLLVAADAEAGGAAHGGVDHITAQGHRVLQGGGDIIQVRAAGGTEDLHDHQLGIGSHARHVGAFHLIGSGDTGHVGAVVALGIGAVVRGQVGIHIVEGIGDLSAAVQILGAQPVQQIVSVELGQDLLNRRLGHGAGSQLGIGGEGGMVQVQAGIDHRDLHAGAGIAQVLPHIGHAGHLAGGHGVGRYGHIFHFHRLEDRHDEHALDTIEHGDLLQPLKLDLHGEAVEQVSELVADLQLLAVQHVPLDLVDQLVLCRQEAVLLGGLDAVDGAVGRRKGLFLQHHESRHHLVGLILFGHAPQVLNGLRELGLDQVEVPVHLCSVPGAAAGDGLPERHQLSSFIPPCGKAAG